MGSRFYREGVFQEEFSDDRYVGDTLICPIEGPKGRCKQIWETRCIEDGWRIYDFVEDQDWPEVSNGSEKG